MPLQHIYRPESLEYFYGNKALKKSLSSALKRKKDQPQSYFMSGPSGCGKTNLAEIISIEVGIPLDSTGYRYYDAATTRGIDTIRGIRDILSYGGKTIFVMDEFHQVTGAASEALLIALENPPPDKYFVLCTSEPGKVKATIKRRCFNGEVKPLKLDDMWDLVADVLATEEIEVDDRLIQRVIKNAEGSPGIALNMLDSIIDIHEDINNAIDVLESWSEVSHESMELCRAVAAKRWNEAQSNLMHNKTDAIVLTKNILGYLRKIMLNPKSDHDKLLEVTLMMEEFFKIRPEYAKPGLIHAVYMACCCGADNDDLPF